MTGSSRPGAESQGHRSGFVALVGRPNVGKSTLLNRILGQKLAPVSPKPQTTRRNLLGIKTLPDAQIVFIDTPGLHLPRSLLTRRMVDRARQGAGEAQVLVWLIDATRELDRAGLDLFRTLDRPPGGVIVALNKIDRVRPKDRLLPLIEALSRELPDVELIPLSAIRGDNLDRLLEQIVSRLPEGPRYYDEDSLSNEPMREIVAEIIREKAMMETDKEVSYALAVSIDEYDEQPERDLVVIKATIHVDRATQKPILVGHRGQRVKAIGQRARIEIEKLVDARVFLELFVRVQEDWTRNEHRLREFGL